MIEVVIRNYLMNTVTEPVYAVIPEKITAPRYYVIEKTSGGMENRIKSSTIVVQSYAESMAAAMAMNDAVIDALIDCDADEVASVRLNADYNFTDPNMQQFRYQAVFDITHY